MTWRKSAIVYGGKILIRYALTYIAAVVGIKLV